VQSFVTDGGKTVAPATGGWAVVAVPRESKVRKKAAPGNPDQRQSEVRCRSGSECRNVGFVEFRLSDLAMSFVPRCEPLLGGVVLLAKELCISKVKLHKMVDQPELHQVSILDGQLPFSPDDLRPEFH